MILRKYLRGILKILLVYPFYTCKFKIKYSPIISKLRRENKPIYYLIATPEHSNLGDHAIVFAQLNLLYERGLSEQIIEIPNNTYLRLKYTLSLFVKKTDVILIDGGGNLGTLWPWEDDKITFIIRTFKENKIIIFPQTCYYDNSLDAQNRLDRNVKIYANALNLNIALRDEKSFNLCKMKFPSNVNLILVPDIVLSLCDKSIINTGLRRGALLCFRSDLEKVFSNEDVSNLKKYLEGKNISYKESSTLTDYDVNKEIREKELLKKWREFASAQIVITDRLHAMIFAIITNTPCIAVDNLSKKVSGVYGLIKIKKGVHICSNLNDIKNVFEAVYSENNVVINKLEFKELINIL